MEVKPTVAMALKHKGLVVGIKTAHYAGPEWDPFSRSVEAGKLADIPVMVDFGSAKVRTIKELFEQVVPPRRHLHALLRGMRARVIDGKINPAIFAAQKKGSSSTSAMAVGASSAGQRCRPSRKGVRGHHLDRHAHQQHERRHEGHAERDEQVPGSRNAARPGDRQVDVGAREGHQAGGPRTPLGGCRGGCRRLAAREGPVRLRGSGRRPAVGHAEADCGSDNQGRQDRVRPQRPGQPGMEHAPANYGPTGDPRGRVCAVAGSSIPGKPR